ncbi:unnamed protein product [Boreogadus saida]
MTANFPHTHCGEVVRVHFYCSSAAPEQENRFQTPACSRLSVNAGADRDTMQTNGKCPVRVMPKVLMKKLRLVVMKTITVVTLFR